jgi:hypothetical protein
MTGIYRTKTNVNFLHADIGMLELQTLVTYTDGEGNIRSTEGQCSVRVRKKRRNEATKQRNQENKRKMRTQERNGYEKRDKGNK